MFRIVFAIMLGFTLFAASGRTQQSSFEFSNDKFMAGNDIVQIEEGVDDLFMAGATITNQKDITGSAHMVGRKVVSSGTIGGDAYLSGVDVTINGKISGDTTIAAMNIKVGEVNGDVRATGQNITLSEPVSGYALLAAETIQIDSIVTGDVSMAGEDVNFGEQARIDGKLVLYEEEKGEVIVPANVIAEDRIERREMADWSEDMAEQETKGLGGKIFNFIKRLIFIIVVASVIAAIRPHKLTTLKSDVLAHPLRNILFGFLTISLCLGAIILWMFTGLSFLLVLVVVFSLVVAVFIGYVLGAYAVGAKTLQWAGRPASDGIGGHALTALIGALVVSIIALTPYLGWLFVFALLLAGLGSMAVRLFKPVVYKDRIGN